MIVRILFFSLMLSVSFIELDAQAILRGNVYDQDTGEPIAFGTIRLQGTDLGTNTDLNGFFSLGNVPAGAYTIIVTYIGYDSLAQAVQLQDGKIEYRQLRLRSNAVNLTTVDVSAERERARSDIQVSQLTVTPKQIRSLPSTGGDADIAQYLPVLPGVIVSGDQGGQLYIRGGSPVQNKILLDGMTIFNPFHSIGFFSVFETETIRSVDVLTGGFNVEHGGRISAVVDIKTREGNKKRFSGLVSASPFQAKALLEGPIIPWNEERGNSVSFLFTGKHSYLDQTSPSLYAYAVDTSYYAFAAADTSLAGLADNIGLPFRYTDWYGKLSMVGGGGSQLNLFGFNFVDAFDFAGLAAVDWTTSGAGANFTLVPPNSNIVMDGLISFSSYDITLKEGDAAPRRSGVTNFGAQLNFKYFGNKNQLNYGFEVNGFNTDFSFENFVGLDFEQRDFTTELSGYFKYKQEIGNMIIEPGVRLHFYASQSAFSFEPRMGVKYKASDRLRFKAAGGFYSQNLISTVNESDVVNFFVGFLAGPEESLFRPGTFDPTNHRLQKSAHAVAGVEFDVNRNASINVEPYYKRFTQLININRNKLSATDPDFAVETGNAYGVDFSYKYENPQWYLWLTYSLGYVDRFDGEQTYFTIFDRRHNINALSTYQFGRNKSWEASLRWNFGSGFPFTETQGFFQNIGFDQILVEDILQGNFDLGTILADKRNGGRLSTYHRLDASVKKRIELVGSSFMEIVASVTNVYDRENVFYLDRITNTRVNQFPILPSASIKIGF
ncbi:MAG: TonB-dependent receptor [Saprospiraceae bacterium]|nr:TonB-dependent receptor [Saprospiraceae bacterium]